MIPHIDHLLGALTLAHMISGVASWVGGSGSVAAQAATLALHALEARACQSTEGLCCIDFRDSDKNEYVDLSVCLSVCLSLTLHIYIYIHVTKGKCACV